jgi:predicted nuclease with RNAse H fold
MKELDNKEKKELDLNKDKSNTSVIRQISQFKIPYDYKIIGLDLTGSEKRASGWAFLENGHVITKRIKTDAEIIAEITHLNPSLVSIDCPLSLPKGRISVGDDDPGRYQFGITRECERLLLKRGIRSYPPLIRSMQQLTQRGITLAQRIRNLGFTVIESYPGGAQDILGLPRKQKDLKVLIAGLKAFGIQGFYDGPGIVHDEIDAITCSLVGLCYLSGHFEALGNDDEGYLIVPDLKKTAV